MEKKAKIRIRIPETSNRWEPKKPGEVLKGKFCKKEAWDFRGKKNSLYSIKSEDHPIADEDGIVVFFGTSVLNDVLGKIVPGYDVEILFKGKKPSPDPKRQPKMLFDVDVWVDPTDPILYKLYPDGLPEEIQTKIDEIRSQPGSDSPKEEVVNDRNIEIFVTEIEEDLVTSGDAVSEQNVWQLARDRAGEDKTILEAIKKEIRKRDY